MVKKLDRIAQLRRLYTGCGYCSGPIETEEHCPPKILFTGSHRPKGWEFPACKLCNAGTSQADQIMAFFVFSQILKPSRTEEQHLDKIMRALGNNHADIVFEMRLRARNHGLIVRASMPSSMAAYIEQFLDKMAASAYFKIRRKALPSTTQIKHFTLTNEYIFRNGYPAALKQLPVAFDSLKQGTWNTSNQFRHRSVIMEQDGVMMSESHFQNATAVISVLFLNEDPFHKKPPLDWSSHRFNLDALRNMHC